MSILTVIKFESLGFLLSTVLKLFVHIGLLLDTIHVFCNVCIILLGILISSILRNYT
jgi:hypothetical protein